MEWETIFKQAFYDAFEEIIDIFTTPAMMGIYIAALVTGLIGLVIYRLVRWYSRLTGDSENGARKKARSAKDLLSVICSLGDVFKK